MKLLYVSLALLVSGSVWAAPAQLSDGRYRTSSPNYCDEIAVNDLNSGNLLLEVTGNCGDAGSYTTFVRSGDTLFTSDTVTNVDDAFVNKCTPNKKSKTPCDSWLYDSHGLLAQAGDQVVDFNHLTILNPTAFQLDSGTNLVHAGQVVKEEGKTVSLIFTQPFPNCGSEVQ